MILPLFRRNARQDTISTLYGTIVAQARLPCFYREYGVPDTVNGRFDLLVLHIAFVLDRLADDPELRHLGQAIFDLFCKDMDHNLREMGVGDLSVPKEMQRIGEAFYGRAQAFWAENCSCRIPALVFLLKIRTGSQKTEIHGKKSKAMERSGGPGRYSGNRHASRN